MTHTQDYRYSFRSNKQHTELNRMIKSLIA